MYLEGPTAASLMYSDTGGAGPVVVLLHGVLMNGTPVGHRHRRPGGSLPLHRPGAAVRRAHHAERLAEHFENTQMLWIDDSRTLIPIDQPRVLTREFQVAALYFGVEHAYHSLESTPFGWHRWATAGVRAPVRGRLESHENQNRRRER